MDRAHPCLTQIFLFSLNHSAGCILKIKFQKTLVKHAFLSVKGLVQSPDKGDKNMFVSWIPQKQELICGK